MKTALVALGLVLVTLGCSGTAPEPVPAASSAGSEQPLVPPGEARVGDRTICIVSNEEFIVGEESPHAEHEGRTYYFCCAPCVARFQGDPERYLAD